MLEIKNLTTDMYDTFIIFINEHWKSDHIFTYAQEIFDFQHLCEDSSYNFLISILDNEIVGIFGYIPINQYSKKLSADSVWGAIWKVTDKAPAGLGLKMLKIILKRYNSYGAIGLSQDAVRMYQALRYTTGVVKQYYILNPFIDSYKIAKAKAININNSLIKESLFIDANSLDGIENIKAYYLPAKDITYFINRYENHPIYKYQFLIIPDKILIVYRILEVNGARCIRIIDLLGDLNAVGKLYDSFLQLMIDKNVEYIDCLNFGLDFSVFSMHGFKLLNPESNNIIIPNYFEPFVQQNIVLHCAHNSKEQNYTFFKGDADQDRPNILKV